MFFLKILLELENLLRKADIAMYEAKRRKCGVYVFTEQLNKINTRTSMISKELNNALDKNEFSLVYQPQFDVETKRKGYARNLAVYCISLSPHHATR